MIVSSSNYGYPKKIKLVKKKEKVPPTPKTIALKKLVRAQRVRICRLEKKVRSLEQELTEKFKNSTVDREERNRDIFHLRHVQNEKVEN